MSAHHLVELGRPECMRLLASARIGRVGVSVDALPVILPVLIATTDAGLVFRTVPGTKLEFAAANAVVAVEADEFAVESGEGWSVLVRGVASALVDDPDVSEARGLLGESWIDGSAAEHYVRVSADLVTGRRLRR